MASDTDTAKPERSAAAHEARPHRTPWLTGSRLGRLIIILNFLGLVILIVGVLVLNELRQGLVNARIDSLTTQGQFMVNIIDRAATVGEPAPAMDADRASEVLQILANPGPSGRGCSTPTARWWPTPSGSPTASKAARCRRRAAGTPRAAGCGSSA
jgi:hypothetical protein